VAIIRPMRWIALACLCTLACSAPAPPSDVAVDAAGPNGDATEDVVPGLDVPVDNGGEIAAGEDVAVDAVRGDTASDAAPDAPATCPDRDTDGHRDRACGGDDCNDGDRDTHPGAAEGCDAVDRDCDGSPGRSDTYCATTAPVALVGVPAASWSSAPRCAAADRPMTGWPAVPTPQCQGRAHIADAWLCWINGSRATNCPYMP
jgi:hypothetical protein